MRTLSHPLRLDASGQLATIDDSSAAAAAQLAGHVLSTDRGERPLAPAYGVDDPLQAGLSSGAVAAAIALSEPELELRSVDVSLVSPGRVRARIDVDWSS